MSVTDCPILDITDRQLWVDAIEMAKGEGVLGSFGETDVRGTSEAMIKRYDALVAVAQAALPLIDPDVLHPFYSAWEFDMQEDGEKRHEVLKAALESLTS